VRPCAISGAMFCLCVATDPSWAREAACDLDSVLVDHAHCEMKAATNALSLVVKHHDDLPLVRALTELAREELDHFHRVVSFIEGRGLALGLPPVDDYAAELRRATSRLPASSLPLVVDRLLFSALIEARSCERFKLLIDALPAETPPELRAFYRELFECEARHYRTYVDLAVQAVGEGARGRADVEARLALLAEAEGRIVRALADRDERATVHG
jgi:tRNA 2-(methylsulfanyl)-N6-isopentenyladenosine37 hydroxylase